MEKDVQHWGRAVGREVDGHRDSLAQRTEQERNICSNSCPHGTYAEGSSETFAGVEASGQKHVIQQASGTKADGQ